MFKILKHTFLFVFISLTAVACDEHDHDHDTEAHVDAEGFVLENNGTVVYRQFEGEVTVNNLILSVDETLDLSVHFLDHDGDEIEHEEGEHEEDALSFEISNSDIISIVMEDHEDEDGDDDHDHDHEEHHELGFELMGVSSGTTTFKLSLMHDGHADFTSLPISVTVNPAMLSCTGKQLCLLSCCASTIYATK